MAYERERARAEIIERVRSMVVEEDTLPIITSHHAHATYLICKYAFELALAAELPCTCSYLMLNTIRSKHDADALKDTCIRNTCVLRSL